jgi:hypothetical protein
LAWSALKTRVTGCVTRGLYLAADRIMFRVMNEIVETPGQKRARQKRKAAERARQYRLRKKGMRTPLPRDVDAAWSEATAYWLAKHYADLRAAGETAETVTMPVHVIMRIARAILERQGCARRSSTIAIAERLAPRKEHEDPDHVPAVEPRVGDIAPVRQPKRGHEWDDWDALLDDMIEA